MSSKKSTSTKYPKSVAFIISNEFCERFNYYGMRTILVLYLTNKLHYDPNTATILFHVFTMLVYFFPLVGALIADSCLGKFKTVLYLSIVYAIGGVIIAIGAIPPLHLPVQTATILGLLLIAFGTGGIKPCVSAFGGDQFKLPEQAKQLATFFSLFYFAINAGSMISTSITPIMREDVHCFGDADCFSLAFGVPAVLMLVSVIIFIAGKTLYVIKHPSGNMIFSVSTCIHEAYKGWRKNGNSSSVKHFLDYAEEKCGSKLVDDTKILFKILVLYLPFPVFWALFDQQGSRWTFQAARMNGALFGYNIKPDQMQVINPLLILGFIPLFDYVIYPLLSHLGIRRPLQKLTVGGLLAATAFVLSALVELKIEAHDPNMPAHNEVHLRLYNGMNCNYDFHSYLPDEIKDLNVNALGVLEQHFKLRQFDVVPFNATSNHDLCGNISGAFELSPGKSISYFIGNGYFQKFDDIVLRPESGYAWLRVLINTRNENDQIVIVNAANANTEVSAFNTSQFINVPKGDVSLMVNGKLIEKFAVRNGGIYTLLVGANNITDYVSKINVVLEPYSVHMLWQLPQIIVITAAEIMFSVTGLEFSFTQAPESMKSVLQACWLLSVAIGNMLVVVIAELKIFNSQASEFLLFSALMVADMFVFVLLAMRYQYVDHPKENYVQRQNNSSDQNNGNIETIQKDFNSGHANTAFVID